MRARDAILKRVKANIKTDKSDDARREAVRERLIHRPLGILPKRAEGTAKEICAQFISAAEAAQAQVSILADPADVPEAIALFLQEQNLPLRLIHGKDARLVNLPWQKTAQIMRRTGPSAGQDLVGLTHAEAGIAETGTLALLSGPENPSTLNFLPDTHIVVVRADDIISHYENFWQAMKGDGDATLLPRTVNFITGPSRSGDIEQKILLGAHGPRQLKIFITHERVR